MESNAAIGSIEETDDESDTEASDEASDEDVSDEGSIMDMASVDKPSTNPRDSALVTGKSGPYAEDISPITREEAIDNVEYLTSQAKSWLAVLFNVFTSVERDGRPMVGDVISAWGKIAKEPVRYHHPSYRLSLANLTLLDCDLLGAGWGVQDGTLPYQPKLRPLPKSNQIQQTFIHSSRE